MKDIHLTLLLLTGIIWQSGRAKADPIAMYGVGGTLQPISGQHRTIRMVQEEIRVALPQRRVDVRYVFRNEGPATTVVMGFPEAGQTGDVGKFPHQGFMRDFHSFVDGQRVSVTRYVPPDGLSGRDEYESTYKVFWIKRVHFGRGQTRVLRDTYTGGTYGEKQGGPEGGTRQHFSYILQTGTAWKGSIGRLRVVLDTQGLSNFTEQKFDFPTTPHGAPYRRVRDTVQWEAHNIEPQADVEVSWWPGVRQFEINGEALSDRCLPLGQEMINGEYPAVYPQRRGGKIWVPLRLFKTWLPDSPTGSSPSIFQAALPDHISLTWHERHVYFVIGERELEVTETGKADRRLTMSAPAYFERGVAMVELIPVVQALGGRVTMRHDVVQIWLK